MEAGRRGLDRKNAPKVYSKGREVALRQARRNPKADLKRGVFEALKTVPAETLEHFRVLLQSPAPRLGLKVRKEDAEAIWGPKRSKIGPHELRMATQHYFATGAVWDSRGRLGTAPPELASSAEAYTEGALHGSQ